MKFMIGIVILAIIFFNYCIFKVSSNVDKLEEKHRK